MEINHHVLQSIIKKGIGVVLIIIGILCVVAPVIPGAWLIFIGLQLLGLNMLFWEAMEKFFSKKLHASSKKNT